MNKFHRQFYAPVLDLIAGIQKTSEWRDYMCAGAEPMDRDAEQK